MRDVVIIIVVVAVLSAVLIPAYRSHNARDHVASCKTNLKNIGTSLEMHASNNSGRYPVSLSMLVGNELRAIPTCPAAGTDTYSASYDSLG